ncbi:DUF6318 family protein [Paenarthrobacter nicotinovorans]|uniref:DUF6318 family protein n=1 Tax=Paenarthrobacter nicotinovorans TaxID=29320 RepID=UPI003A7FCD17
MPRLTYAALLPLRARPAAIVVVAAVLLSGCQGGSPTAGNSETHTTTASPTSGVSSPVASAAPPSSGAYKPADASGKAQNVPVPVMPELAKENSKAGLEAFIGYWYATYSYAIETGDLTAWSKVTDTTLPVAIAHRDSVKLNYVEGRWMAGGRLTVPVVEVSWNSGSDQIHSSRVQVLQEPIRYYDAGGTKGQEDSAATNTADAVFAKYVAGSWQVTDYGSIVG